MSWKEFEEKLKQVIIETHPFTMTEFWAEEHGYSIKLREKITALRREEIEKLIEDIPDKSQDESLAWYLSSLKQQLRDKWL
jgi:predicted nuclease with RNAse H fold